AIAELALLRLLHLLHLFVVLRGLLIARGLHLPRDLFFVRSARGERERCDEQWDPSHHGACMPPPTLRGKLNARLRRGLNLARRSRPWGRRSCKRCPLR